jgi:hypothetical protein
MGTGQVHAHGREAEAERPFLQRRLLWAACLAVDWIIIMIIIVLIIIVINISLVCL